MTRLLVVDDDPTTVERVRATLETESYACFTASGGAEALEVIRRTPGILLVISDINMPGINGIALLEQLNAMTGSAPRVIFLTAHPSVDYAVAALRLGAIDFLTKPVRPDSLREIVRNAIARVQQAHDASRPAATLAARAEQPTQAHDIALLILDHLRRLRRSFTSVADLDDVAWDLLRELLTAERKARRLSVSALSGTVEDVSSTTALRRIHELVKAGYIVRVPDPTDARRDFVALAPEIRSTLEQYLEQIAHELGEIARAY